MSSSTETADSDEDINEINPLDFYKAHKATFPILTTIVRQLFCVPATSVPVEALFSKAGMIQTDIRNRLNPLRLEYYCFLNHNKNIF